MRIPGVSSGTIAVVFPSMPQDGDRDPWGDDVSREIARSAPRAASGVYGAVPDDVPPESADDPADAEHDEEIPEVPVRRELSLAIAGFAGLLGAGLILGAQTSGPDARTPYAIVIFGVQVLFVLAWTMAMHPPAPGIVAGVCAVVAAWADYSAISTVTAGLGFYGLPVYLRALTLEQGFSVSAVSGGLAPGLSRMIAPGNPNVVPHTEPSGAGASA